MVHQSFHQRRQLPRSTCAVLVLRCLQRVPLNGISTAVGPSLDGNPGYLHSTSKPPRTRSTLTQHRTQHSTLAPPPQRSASCRIEPTTQQPVSRDVSCAPKIISSADWWIARARASCMISTPESMAVLDFDARKCGRHRWHPGSPSTESANHKLSNPPRFGRTSGLQPTGSLE